MSKILTPEEMDALLSSSRAMQLEQAEEEAKRDVRGFDFKQKERVSKDQLKSLNLLFDQFVRKLSASLSIQVRAAVEVSLTSVKQQTYADFMNALPDPCVMVGLNMTPLSGVSVLEFSNETIFPLLDLLLGGSGQVPSISRPITEIEQLILDGIFKAVIKELREAWSSVYPIEFEFAWQESKPQAVQLYAPSEAVISFSFNFQINQAQSNVNLFLPIVSLEPVLGSSKGGLVKKKKIAPDQVKKSMENLKKASFEVCAEIRGTTITMRELLNLSSNDIIRLRRKVADPIDICVAGLHKFSANLVEINGTTVAQVAGKQVD